MDDITAKTLIYNRVKSIITEYNDKFSFVIPLNMLTIKYNIKSTTAGKANFSKLTLWFNLQLFKDNVTEFDQTIYHEIAHLYQRGMYPNSAPHGLEFKSIMALMNRPQERCHNYDCSNIKTVSRKNHLIVCKNCHHEYKVGSVYYNKFKTQPYNYRCRFCHTEQLWPVK